MSDLRKAAQQALEALEGVLDTYGEPLDLMTISGGTYEAIDCRDAITALRAALAQPDPVEVRRGWEYMREKGLLHPKPEPWMGVSDNPQTCPNPCNFEGRPKPVQEPYTDDVTRIMREAGVTFHLGLPHKAVVEQMSRVVDLVYAEASIKAAQQFATAPPQRKPLTEADIKGIVEHGLQTWKLSESTVEFARAIEQAHGIGGEA